MSDHDRVKPYLCGANAAPEPVIPTLIPKLPGSVHSQKEHERLFPGQPCFYCGDAAQSVDHMIPRSKGGSNLIGNKVPACHRCNQMKGDMLVEEFVAHMERILQTLRAKKVIQFPIQFGGERLWRKVA